MMFDTDRLVYSLLQIEEVAVLFFLHISISGCVTSRVVQLANHLSSALIGTPSRTTSHLQPVALS